MKVFLQDVETGQLLQGLAGWTTNPELALDFETIPRATEFWKDNDLLKTQLVLRYNNSHDVILDVLPERATPD